MGYGYGFMGSWVGWYQPIPMSFPRYMRSPHRGLGNLLIANFLELFWCWYTWSPITLMMGTNDVIHIGMLISKPAFG